jgi:methionyl aminopeptidase
MIYIKNKNEIEKIKKAGAVVAKVLNEISVAVKPGVSKRSLNILAEEIIRKHDAKPAFLGYHGYPACICVSVNQEVVHGIPDGSSLNEGDIVGIDVGVEKNGYIADAAKTFPVGKISSVAKKIIQVTEKALALGIAQAVDKAPLQNIGATIQNFVEKNGFSIVRDLVGHGVGKLLHEQPQIPNYGVYGKGPELSKGMTLAIEPMVNAGSWKVKTLSDGWTVVTKDGNLSAHFEHTIAITEGAPQILTAVF